MAHQKLGMDTDLQTLPIPLLQFHPQAKSLGHHLVQMVPARLCLLTSGHSMPSHEEEAKTCWRKSQPAKPRHCQPLSGSLTAGSPPGQPRLSSPGDEEKRDTVSTNLSSVSSLSSGKRYAVETSAEQELREGKSLTDSVCRVCRALVPCGAGGGGGAGRKGALGHPVACSHTYADPLLFSF